MTHPSRRLDDTVHQRIRLGIPAVLCETGRADFGYLRRTLELADGNLSRNLTRLEGSGYVRIDKVLDGRRPRTWVSATTTRRAALNSEIAALRDSIARVDKPAPGRAGRMIGEQALRPCETCPFNSRPIVPAKLCREHTSVWADDDVEDKRTF